MLKFILYLFYNNIIITFAYINLKHEIMGRKKIIDRGKIKKSFTITIEEEWISKYDKDVLREIACNAIIRYNEINNQKTK